MVICLTYPTSLYGRGRVNSLPRARLKVVTFQCTNRFVKFHSNILFPNPLFTHVIFFVRLKSIRSLIQEPLIDQLKTPSFIRCNHSLFHLLISLGIYPNFFNLIMLGLLIKMTEDEDFKLQRDDQLIHHQMYMIYRCDARRDVFTNHIGIPSTIIVGLFDFLEIVKEDL